MKTINDRNRDWVLATIVAVLAGIAVAMGCAGTPRTPQQIEEMGEGDFQSWLVRVTAWSQIAASQVAREHPEDAVKIAAFSDIVVSLASDPDPLGAAASQAGLGSPIVAVLVLEAKALLSARGALPSGRMLEFLRAVAAGARVGVSQYLPQPTEG